VIKMSRRNLFVGAGAVVLSHGVANAAPLPIAEGRFVPIGGIDQWISIRGRNPQNPALLFLHGGPAQPQSLFPEELASWEADFNIIRWDQRGSGKTFGKYGLSTPDMTTERLAQDGLEVADYARRRLNKQKIILVAHSWGTALGLRLLQRQQEPFAAFFGVSQLTSWKRMIEDRDAWTRKQATAAGDTATLKALDEVSKLPITDSRTLHVSDKWASSPSDEAWMNARQKFLSSPPAALKKDAAEFMSGIMFTGDKLFPTMMSFDARQVMTEFTIPFFVLQGRDDHMVSFDDAKAYVAEVRAPAKEFIPVDGGHFAIFTNSNQVLSVIRDKAKKLQLHEVGNSRRL
jgi:proline iminopeptidase